MNCLGHIFDERPQVATSHIGHYTVPPRQSVVIGEKHGNLFAIDLDGFEWVRLADIPVWTPTGAWMEGQSIEDRRNFKMRKTW